MSRKSQIQPYKTITLGDMSQASLTSLTTHVKQTDVAQYNVLWSGGQATNGIVEVEADNGDGVWFPLVFGTTINLDGASGTHQLVITQVSFSNVRLIYTRTNGAASGSLDVTIFSTTRGA